MNTHRLIVIATLSVVSFAVQAHQPADKIVVNCSSFREPSMIAVQDVFDTTNTTETSRVRNYVIELAKHACKNGTNSVTVISATKPNEAVAQTDHPIQSEELP